MAEADPTSDPERSSESKARHAALPNTAALPAMPKGTLTVRLIAGYGLKLEKWFDDNEPYVELSPSNFNAQNPVWKSGVATPTHAKKISTPSNRL